MAGGNRSAAAKKAWVTRRAGGGKMVSKGWKGQALAGVRATTERLKRAGVLGSKPAPSFSAVLASRGAFRPPVRDAFAGIGSKTRLVVRRQKKGKYAFESFFKR